MSNIAFGFHEMSKLKQINNKDPKNCLLSKSIENFHFGQYNNKTNILNLKLCPQLKFDANAQELVVFC
eukprot:TRINITY_DN14468_c0_g1_i1.p1 TRINITY_DN14468_c0_g1~~TRINITY_DN14468_c0_g1_i1.p1  ORF type:complete len:68 (-),score=14.06 TRINITY_DN14468_c0_g1_i1:194-397(-)